MAPALSVALFLEMFCSMDYYDPPKVCPLIEGRPFRYSVGFYRGRHRYVVAWFDDRLAATDYCSKARLRHPKFKFDLLQSLF